MIMTDNPNHKHKGESDSATAVQGSMAMVLEARAVKQRSNKRRAADVPFVEPLKKRVCTSPVAISESGRPTKQLNMISAYFYLLYENTRVHTSMREKHDYHRPQSCTHHRPQSCTQKYFTHPQMAGPHHTLFHQNSRVLGKTESLWTAKRSNPNPN